jgi:hypothetical protein
MRKIESRQRYITTSEDLSEYGYVKSGNQNGTQMWVFKEVLYAENTKYHEAHQEEEKVRSAKYYKEHPEYFAKHYEKHSEELKAGMLKYQKEHRLELNEYQCTGLQGERNKIRQADWRKYKHEHAGIPYPVDIHHEWIPGTAQCRGCALVDRKAHRHGIIKIVA